MRKFLINTILFLIILIAINIGLYILANKIYYSSYKQYQLNYNSYLLGDSHGIPLGQSLKDYGIYNFSAESDSYIDMKRKLNFLIKNTSVDTIFITIDDHTLSPYREKLNNADRSVFFATMDDYDNIFTYVKEKALSKMPFFQPKTSSILKAYFYAQVKSFIRKSTVKKREPNEWALLKSVKRKELAQNRYLKQFPTKESSNLLKATLLDIVAKCKKHKITLIGIQFPLSKEYINALGNTSYGAVSLFKSLEIKTIDFTKLFENQTSYFKDQDHLNKDGSKAFMHQFIYKLSQLYNEGQ
jgi:hypothetical protein